MKFIIQAKMHQAIGIDQSEVPINYNRENAYKPYNLITLWSMAYGLKFYEVVSSEG